MYYKPEYYVEEDVEQRADYHCNCAGECCAEKESGWLDRLKAANAWLRDALLVLDEIAGPVSLVAEDRIEPGCRADALGAEVHDVWQRAEFVASRLHDLMGRF